MRRTGTKGQPLPARRTAGVAALALAVGGVLAVTGLAGTGASGGDPAPAAFRLPDGSVACNYEDGTVACRADSAPSVLVLEPDGSSHDDEGRHIAWDSSTPVLLPGESWWHGDVSCRASVHEIVCATGTGELYVGADGAAGSSADLFETG
jgi:hypothetical protein